MSDLVMISMNALVSCQFLVLVIDSSDYVDAEVEFGVSNMVDHSHREELVFQYHLRKPVHMIELVYIHSSEIAVFHQYQQDPEYSL